MEREQPLNIIFIGQQWLGSNARGLAYAFRHLGNIVHIIDENSFIPSAGSNMAKAIRRLGRRVFERDFNDEILQRDSLAKPDLVVVSKGAAVHPETISALKGRGRIVFLFFPDVSMFVHGRNIPRAIPLYHHIFTTKTFGIDDLRTHFKVENAEVLLHGFDPDVHKPIPISGSLQKQIGADVSFIGTWSPKKEKILAGIVNPKGNFRLAIWGSQWERCRSPALKPSIRHEPVIGDLYAACICASKINVAILSEIRTGASSGDAITSRTFHIPASGGFMLHERTNELLNHFQEGVEVACFSNGQELRRKVEYYLDHPEERESIRRSGFTKCVKENSLVQRAAVIVSRYLSHRGCGNAQS